MAYNTKINLYDERVYQNSGQTLTLSGDTLITSTGSLKYSEHPTFTENTQIVDKQYVDDIVNNSVNGGTTYNLSSPTTVSVGGLSDGVNIDGKTSNEILECILTPYQYPSFSSFTNSTISSILEVGTLINGTASFGWSFNNDANISSGNLMCIIDVTVANSTIGHNVSNVSPQTVTLNNKTVSSCGETFIWKGVTKNSKGESITSMNTVVTGMLPYFWGKISVPGVAGSNRPSTLAANVITGGTKVLATSCGQLGITFNSGDNDYVWFAIPSSVIDKNSWYVDGINSGVIGGGVSAACNLFPDPVIVSGVANNCWSSQSFDVYISNKQSSIGTILIS